MITLARRKKTKRPSLDKQILKVRALLEQADREYFRAAAEDIRRYGETAHAMTHFPLWLWQQLTEVLVDCAQAGWDLAIERAKRRIDGRTARIFSDGDQLSLPFDDVTREVLKVATDIVMPREAIAQYVAERIPPLKYTTENARRLVCRDIVADTIRDGEGVDEIVAKLEREGLGNSAWHRETIARVETAVLFEYGQQAEYLASPMVAGWEYVAIIDSRTSDICDWMDGRRFRKDNANGMIPPLHYNCRSTTDPIFIFDEGVDWDDPQAVIEAAKQDEKPLPGFGEISYGDMPSEEPREELYRKLDAAGSAKARRLAEELRGKARSIGELKTELIS